MFLFTSESVTEGHPDKGLIWIRCKQSHYYQRIVRTGYLHKVAG